MASVQTSAEIFDQTHLQIRAKLLELAAALDRLERADPDGELADDPRLQNIQAGIAVLASRGIDRAERIQIAFSDPYDADWNT